MLNLWDSYIWIKNYFCLDQSSMHWLPQACFTPVSRLIGYGLLCCTTEWIFFELEFLVVMQKKNRPQKSKLEGRVHPLQNQILWPRDPVICMTFPWCGWITRLSRKVFWKQVVKPVVQRQCSFLPIILREGGWPKMRPDTPNHPR